MTQNNKAGARSRFIKASPRLIRWLWIIAFAPVALLVFLLLLTATGLFGRLPSFEELENPKSNLATEIYSEDGKVLGTFFVQNRSYVQYDELYPADSTLHIRLGGHEVPPVVAALIATEDARFRSHSGIDIPSLARVAVKTVLLQNTSQGGGSTITQQLAKNLFPRDTARHRGKIARTSKLVVSKLKEWITALKLEYNYTKEEIAAMYLNTVAYGSNAYGGPYLLQQGAPRTERAGGRRAGGGGQRPDALLAGAQPRERSGAPQPGPHAHAAGRGADARPGRFALGAAHRAQLQARLAQRGGRDLLPRDASSGDERRAAPPQPVLQRVGLRGGPQGV